MLSKILFYLPLGFTAVLLVAFTFLSESLVPLFITATAIYFLIGLFLGWRIEYKVVFASALILIPLTILAGYMHFWIHSTHIKYVFIAAIISFIVGFLMAKFWNSESLLIKVALLLLLAMGTFSNITIYGEAIAK
jgi:hypothetical protein